MADCYRLRNLFSCRQWIAGCALWTVVLAGCSHEEPAGRNPQPDPAELPVIRAETLQVRTSPSPAIVRTQGNLVADEATVVGAKVEGRVAELHTDLGDSVQEGALLVTLDQVDFRLQVSLAEAQLTQARSALGLEGDDPLEKLVPQNAPPVREAKANLDEAVSRTTRLQSLRAKNAVSQEDFDQAVAAERVADARHAAAVNGVLEKIAQVRVRSAELALAKQRLAETAIKAPFEGTVHQRHVSRGAYVQVGEPIVTLVRSSTLRFRGNMPERYAHRMAVGQEVTLKIESVPDPISARITRISPVVEERNRAVIFEAVVRNQEGQLGAGLFAEAEVVVDPTATAILIPPSSLVEFAGAEKVWKVVEGVAREQVVKTARREKDGIQIIEGLTDGDFILKDASEGRVARIEPVAAQAKVRTVAGSGEASGASASEPDKDNSPHDEAVTGSQASE